MDKISSLANMYEDDIDTSPSKEQQLDEDMSRLFEGTGAGAGAELGGAQGGDALLTLSDPEPRPAPQPSRAPPGFEDNLGPEVGASSDTRVRDTDIKFHRSDTFPHVHHPLKPQHQRRGSSKRKQQQQQQQQQPYSRLADKSEGDTEGEGERESEKERERERKSGVLFQVGEGDEDWRGSSNSKIRKDSTTERETDEEQPLLITDKPKSIIRSSEADLIPYMDDTGEEDQPDLEQRPKKRRSHRSRRHRGDSAVEDPLTRRQAGSDLLYGHTYTHTTDEDDMNLIQHDLDTMTSHRFDDPSAYRRPRVRARSSVTNIIHMTRPEDTTPPTPTTPQGPEGGIGAPTIVTSRSSRRSLRKSERQMPIMKKTYDHTPHEIFVELDELKHTDLGLEWKETARWIKYEEDVNHIDNRWGKPHLAFLNFHALFSLRRGLEGGAVLLDLEERELPKIAERVVDKMVSLDQIPPDQKEAVINVLLLRHKHIRENQSAFKLPSIASRTTLASSDEKISRSPSSSSNLENLRSSVRKAGLSHLFSVNSFTRRHSTTADNGTVKKEDAYTQIDIDGSENTRRDSAPEVRKNKELMKKIPEGAEATAVLVGAVDFLKHPTIAFVRLAEGVMMENLVEVPIPVRFMFVLLGPFHGEMDYHEVGRSISTLMSDKGFHEVAYRAHTRGQLLSAINEFLNSSIVLPPSDWNNKDLVPVDEIQMKAQQMMKKKESLRNKRDHAITAPAGAGGADDGGDRRPPPRDPLLRVGRPFYGLIEDVKIRYPQYLSDLKDGLSGQVAAAAIFIFFAALSAAITFGGMYGDQMDNLIGVGETLLISCVNGLLFALFACQPLLIVGATGPLMIFDMSLYHFAKTYELDFLSLRVWIGVWMTVFGLLVAAFEAVAIVKKFTRFTEEIFSTLVCLIFIYESFVKLIAIFQAHPLQSEYDFMPIMGDMNITNTTMDTMDAMDFTTTIAMDMDMTTMTTPAMDINNMTEAIDQNATTNAQTNATAAYGLETLPQPNTALLSMILMFGTFIIAFKLKHFRNSKFLGRSVRRALGDFGVPISIILMVLLDFLIHDTYTDKLVMPEGIRPSDPSVRGWFINPLGVTKPLPIWCIFMAAPASLLLFFLVFLEENICHLILSKPERNMTKGSGFHFDIVLSCFINFVCGVFGAPFMGPACVRTVSHTSALTVMSSTQAPGESPKIEGVKEQRLSAIVVSILIGLSVLLGSVLNLVPKAVLYGIFLYMGVSSTAGIQFLERFILVLMPVKHHPNVPYVKKVRTWKMHSFTGIQLTMLIILWVVKQSPAALCFPFVLMLLIPIRLYLLPYGFNNQELSALDGKEASAPTSDTSDEPDFYEETHGLPTHVDHHHQS